MDSNHVLPCLLRNTKQLECRYTFTNEACPSAWLNCITKLQSVLVFDCKCPVSLCQNSYKTLPIYVRVNHCEYNASMYTATVLLYASVPDKPFSYYCTAVSPILFSWKKENSQVLEYCPNLQKASKSIAGETAENVPLGSVKIKVATDSLQHQCQARYQRLWVSINNKLQ